jgi:ketosteroid isomerase-like protein
MSEQIEEVLKINEAFYRALQNGDLDLMESLWVKDSRAKCVHPGWPLLLGWEPIRKSWENIFEMGGPTKIQISNVSVEACGNMAWLTCIEHITHILKDQVHRSLAQATNIFELQGSRWFMIHHHASPIPMLEGSMTEEKLQ